MIDWYVCINDPNYSDKYINKIIEISTPCMNYFCNRLSEIDKWSLNDVEDIFNEILDEMPVFTGKVINNEFVIKYNKFVSIRFIENTKEIYRELKLGKILYSYE